MSYEVISAIGKVLDSQAKWEEVDLKTHPLNRIYARYSTVRATLRNRYTKKEGVVLIDDFESLVEEGKTFVEYLEGIGDKAIKLEKGTTQINKKGLLYREALSNRFKVVPVIKGREPDGDLSLKYDYSDLFITKEGVDPIDMYKHTLVSVNGYIHPTDANSKGLWVESGYNTIRKRKKQCIGIYSFENLGSLEQIPIKESMLSKLNNEVDYYDELVIDIGQDCSEKTIILILGGFMHVMDYDVFSRISDTAIKVKLKNTPFMERIHLSSQDLDISPTLYDKRYGETNLHFGDICSDEFIKQYLALPYSFIVLLDNPEVYREITYPQQRGIPNNYLTDKKPTLPMMTRLGKLEEYVSVRDGDKYVLETADCQYRPVVYNTRYSTLEKSSYYTDAAVPGNRFRIPYAYFYNLLTFLPPK